MDVNELLAIAQSNATLDDQNTEELRDTLLLCLCCHPLKKWELKILKKKKMLPHSSKNTAVLLFWCCYNPTEKYRRR